MGVSQIKIFKGVENDLPALESEVNSFLATLPGTVKQIVGNIAPQSYADSTEGPGLSRSGFPPSDILLIVVYEKT